MSKIQFSGLMSLIVVAMASSGACEGSWTLPAPALLLQAEKPADAKAPADQKSLQELLERINKLESEVERLKKDSPDGVKKGTPGEVMALVDIAQLGMVYLPGGQSRYVALHLIVVNTTSKPILLPQDRISAEIDGEVRKLEKIPAELVNHGFRHKMQNYSLSSMQPEKSRTVPAGGQIEFWVVFPKLALTNTIPRCKLKLPSGDTDKEIDVNAVQRAMLALDVERIGPRGCLALMTITGTTTAFNTQSLVDEMERTVAQKTSRVVLRWGADAPPPDDQIQTWLQNSTNPGYVRNTNEIFPSLPGGLREFHLVKFSESENSTNFGYRATASNPNRIHTSAADAVGAALRSAYLALPRDELLQEIREGHPLTRAAALAYGGPRLDTEHLPLIFQWINDKDVDVQRSALQTLSHFGEPEAVEKLVFYTRRNIEPLSSTAIESLAASRFGSAHEALLALLKNEPPESKKKIVQVLAKYPRPVWSETLYEFVSDSRAGLNLDALKALVAVDHPKLTDVLEAGLKNNDKPVRDYCFQTLAAPGKNERSEKLALEYTLNHLKDSPLDNVMMQLLTRMKDARALPLLMEHLERNNGDRSMVINLLIQIGDQTVAEKLAQKYPGMQNSEKVHVLNGLRQFRHPKFREYAGAALLSADGSLVSSAATNLSLEGHPEGQALLITALEKQATTSLLHSITNALANYGTPEARSALMKAKASSDPQKRGYATTALTQLRQRSPGFMYANQGIARLNTPVDPNDKEAKAQQQKDALELFELALKADSQLPEAYVGRGRVLLHQEKLVEAGKDFEKALELSPEIEDMEIVTGLALSKVAGGKIDDAIKQIEGSRKTYKDTPRGLFLYNTACVYGRAVEYLKNHPDVADAAKKSEEYRKKSLSDLEQSIKQGFLDFDWMAKDPDLKVLNDDPDFKKLLASKPAKADEKKSEEE